MTKKTAIKDIQKLIQLAEDTYSTTGDREIIDQAILALKELQRDFAYVRIVVEGGIADVSYTRGDVEVDIVDMDEDGFYDRKSVLQDVGAVISEFHEEWQYARWKIEEFDNGLRLTDLEVDGRSSSYTITVTGKHLNDRVDLETLYESNIYSITKGDL